ncbi:VOC family protein [Frigidibacter sp. SD6-1]|uniref:VOC family protein n=1 Tax=Frigidibacter sp. SD6-1 TaxID=3032581 RepID=UPI0024E014A6|nr:VOC family protein [Frigidibacter sp. SD6-1]
MKIAVSVDVPSIEEGLAFFGDTFCFRTVAEPYTGLALIEADGQRLLLTARAEGSTPHPDATAGRTYRRHWTPVHLDFHVADVAATRDRALAAGARLEAWHEPPGRPPVAFMSDPFGHGFCLIGDPAQAAT